MKAMYTPAASPRTTPELKQLLILLVLHLLLLLSSVKEDICKFYLDRYLIKISPKGLQLSIVTLSLPLLLSPIHPTI